MDHIFELLISFYIFPCFLYIKAEADGFIGCEIECFFADPLIRTLSLNSLDVRISTLIVISPLQKSALQFFLIMKIEFYSFFCSSLSVLVPIRKVVPLKTPGLEGWISLSHSCPSSHSTTIPRSKRPRISEPVIILFS